MPPLKYESGFIKTALLNQVVACTVEHKYDLSSSLTRGTALSSHNCHSGCKCGRGKKARQQGRITQQQQTSDAFAYLTAFRLKYIWAECEERADWLIAAQGRAAVDVVLTDESWYLSWPGLCRCSARVASFHRGPSRMNKEVFLLTSGSLAHCSGHANIQERGIHVLGHTRQQHARETHAQSGETLHNADVLVHVRPHTQTHRGGMWSWWDLHVSRSSSS